MLSQCIAAYSHDMQNLVVAMQWHLGSTLITMLLCMSDLKMDEEAAAASKGCTTSNLHHALHLVQRLNTNMHAHQPLLTASSQGIPRS